LVCMSVMICILRVLVYVEAGMTGCSDAYELSI
jgi:hypothetical protein